MREMRGLGGKLTLFFLAVLLAQQALLPVLADTRGSGTNSIRQPCDEVQIPGVCEEEPSPSPSPSPAPPPAPAPGPDPDGGTAPPGQTTSPSASGSSGYRSPSSSGSFSFGGTESTLNLIALLSRLQPYGVSLRTALLSVAGPFPVAGLAWWQDDWHDARYTPYLHYHEGLDIFAAYGTPLVSTAEGRVTQLLGAYPSGLGVMITDAAGIRYFYAHLSGIVPGLSVGQEVDVGDVIGYVGTSGNASGSTPHLHFEVHINGVPVPPKPYVDRWLQIAEKRAIDLVAETYQTRAPLDEFDFRLTRLFDLSGGGGVPGTQQLLFLAGLQPGLPSFEIAQQALGLMAWEIDWGRAANAQLEAIVRRVQREEAPVRPPGRHWMPFRSLVLAAKASPRAGAG